MHTVIALKWEESERGWGTRPDGYSLHFNQETAAKYVKDYWNTMPDAVPEEYSRPDGRSFLVEIDEETYQKLVESGGSLRIYKSMNQKIVLI